MPHGLLIGTVLFFIVVMGLSMGIPFSYYLKRDHQNGRPQHRH